MEDMDPATIHGNAKKCREIIAQMTNDEDGGFYLHSRERFCLQCGRKHIHVKLTVPTIKYEAISKTDEIYDRLFDEFGEEDISKFIADILFSELFEKLGVALLFLFVIWKGRTRK